MLIPLLIFAVGLTLLTVGADFLVRGAARLAILFGVEPLVVGLTIVAFGTSMPELVVSGQAAWEGQVDVAVGNVIGSNICNILLILGLTAVIAPITCHESVVRSQLPIMIAVIVLVPVLAGVSRLWNGSAGEEVVASTLPRWSGFLLVSLMLAYTYLTYLQDHSSPESHVSEEVEEVVREEARASHTLGHLAVQIGWVILGIALLVVGGKLSVDSAIQIARAIGVSELVIGLTLVALGTSMPEMATSVVAAVRKHSDISVGNVVGSNIFNVLGVLGTTAIIKPVPLSSSVMMRDLPICIAISIACVPIMMTGRRISRAEGAILLAAYAGYVALLAYESIRPA